MADKLSLVFLGTGSAIPTRKHNHPSMLLKYKDENILIDCGEGTQRQFRFANENPCKITKILITHWHADHVLGLPGLFQTLMLNGYNRELKLYGPKGTKQMMSLYLELFIGRGNKLNLSVYEFDSGKIFENEDFIIESEQMNHNTPELAYSFSIKEKNRLDKKKLAKFKIPNGPMIGELKQGKTVEFNGKKIHGKDLIYNEEAKKISFIMDTKLNPNCNKIAKDSDILICESTYSAEEKELAEEHFHLTCEQAANLAKQAKAKKLILTHLSQKHEAHPDLILKEAKKIFKNTVIAEDLMKINI